MSFATFGNSDEKNPRFCKQCTNKTNEKSESPACFVYIDCWKSEDSKIFLRTTEKPVSDTIALMSIFFVVNLSLYQSVEPVYGKLATHGNLFGALLSLEHPERLKRIFFKSTFKKYKKTFLCCHLSKTVAQIRWMYVMLKKKKKWCHRAHFLGVIKK